MGPLFFVYVICGIGSIFLALQAKEKRVIQISKGVCMLLLLSAFVGFCYRNWTEKQKYTGKLDEQEVQFTGKILKRESKNGQEKYVVRVTKLNGKKLYSAIQVQMQCKESGKPILDYGNKVEGKGTWKAFSKARNEGTFDEELYRKSQGISAKITIEREMIKEIQQEKTWISWIKKEREEFCKFLEDRLNQEDSALASAIFIRRKK